jgi:hypothetical protein
MSYRLISTTRHLAASFPLLKPAIILIAYLLR